MPTALVTGATAGIGAAFVRKLADDGFDLVLVARDEERLRSRAEALRAERGVKAEVLRADLATDEGIAAVESRAASVDLLVNNAGFGNRGLFLEVPVEDELRMLRVHCEAVLRLTHAALPGMVERGRGGVINVSSVAAFGTRGTYGASKAWVVSFSQGVAADVTGRNVHVMALCPGFVHTEFHERAGMGVDGIPDFMWLDADRVVADGLRDFRRGVQVSVPGAQYKAIVGLSRLVPHGLVARFSSRTGRKYD
jgi:short-subunit dehydrogenase